MSERITHEFKPCPFCGGVVDPQGWLGGDGRRGPECEDCGASATSIETWQQRSETDLERENAELLARVGRFEDLYEMYGAEGTLDSDVVKEFERRYFELAPQSLARIKADALREFAAKQSSVVHRITIENEADRIEASNE